MANGVHPSRVRAVADRRQAETFGGLAVGDTLEAAGTDIGRCRGWAASSANAHALEVAGTIGVAVAGIFVDTEMLLGEEVEPDIEAPQVIGTASTTLAAVGILVKLRCNVAYTVDALGIPGTVVVARAGNSANSLFLIKRNTGGRQGTLIVR